MDDPRRVAATPAQTLSLRAGEDEDDADFHRTYHAAPCLYQLAFAAAETDVTEAELVAAAPWLEAAIGRFLTEEEYDDEAGEWSDD